MSGKTGWEVARHSAWSKFGQHHWRLFVYGPLLARTVGYLFGLALFVGSGLLVVRYGPSASAWVAQSLVLALCFAAGVTGYAVAAVIVWKVHGWRFAFTSFTRQRYTLACSSVLLVICLGIGLVL